MASIDAASKCTSASSINNEKSKLINSCPLKDGIDASDLSHVHVNSATLYLLKRAASGIPQVANLLWGMLQDFDFGIQDFVWDENMRGIIEGLDALALAEVEALTNSILSSTISPCFYSALNTLQPTNVFEDKYSPDATPDQDDEPPSVTSDMSDSSLCEQNTQDNQGGLVFQTADFNTEESTQRLDYVITQVDISRMARTASRHLNVESIHQLPTITYRAESALICSSHEEEEENVDDFLLRNAHIIEDYFDNTEENNEPLKSEGGNPNDSMPPEFSWMMVPKDPTEDTTRMSDFIIQAGEVPDSISICRSSANSSVNMECTMNDDTYDHCIICQEPFQDGECLRVLPCQHLFHCGCIDKWISGENSSEFCIISGCPMCRKSPPKTLPHRGGLDGYVQETEGESCQSDGSLPPWAFAGLDNLLPGLDNESLPSD